MKKLNLNSIPDRLSAWLPSRGNAIFTLVLMSIFLWGQSTGAFFSQAAPNELPPSTGIVSYQGRLADAAGTPLTGRYDITFRLYNLPGPDAVLLWEESWVDPNSVQVDDGLFNVMLGSLTPIPQSVVADYGTLWLGVIVESDEEMVPRVQLGSVPFAMQANTVFDGSITTAKLADNAVDSAKIGDGTVSSNDIANNTITESDISDSFKARDASLLNGHGTAYFATSGHAHNSLYYTESESNSRFVNTSGNDSMGGNLTVGGEFYLNGNNMYMGGTTSQYVALREDGDLTNLFIAPWGGPGRVYDNVTIGSSDSYRTNLGVWGTISAHQIVASDDYEAGGQNLVIGDDGYFSDIDTPNTIGVYGKSSGTWGYLKTYITSPSSREYKTDISVLDDDEYNSILEQIRDMQVVYYHMLDEDDQNSPLRLGVIAEDAPDQIVSLDGKGVDLYELSTFILAGLKGLSNDFPASTEGLAQLEQGVARVELDTAFLDIADGDFLVHVTPYGDVGLYLDEVGEDYFIVRARDGDLNATFAWQANVYGQDSN